MNFVIANGIVVVPVYGTRAAPFALEALQGVFPTRKIVGLSSHGLLGSGISGGGSFHCITQQEPCDGRRKLTVAALQATSATTWRRTSPSVDAGARGREQGAQVVLPPELFQGIYFPTRQDPKWFATAHPVTEHPSVLALAKLARRA